MEKLILKAQNGDRRAIRQLLITHRHLVEAVVARFLWDRMAWEDVVQNIMLKVVTYIGDFGGACRFCTWVYRIAVNECIEQNRRIARQRKRIDTTFATSDLFTDPGAADGLANTIRREQVIAVNEVVSELPEGLKIAFGLFYREGYTGSEAAQQLNISEEAFFVRLSSARKKIRQKLADRGMDQC